MQSLTLCRHWQYFLYSNPSVFLAHGPGEFQKLLNKKVISVLSSHLLFPIRTATDPCSEGKDQGQHLQAPRGTRGHWVTMRCPAKTCQEPGQPASQRGTGDCRSTPGASQRREEAPFGSSLQAGTLCGFLDFRSGRSHIQMVPLWTGFSVRTRVLPSSDAARAVDTSRDTKPPGPLPGVLQEQ